MNRTRRILLSAVAALVAAMGVVVLPVSPASAHSQVISSNPSDGERIEASPRELIVTLSEAARLPSVIVSLVGPQGVITTLGSATEKSEDSAGHQVVAIPLTADLPTGLYRMTFTATSGFDGHTSSSQRVFGVRTDVAAPIGADAVSTDSLSDNTRGALQGALLIAVGIAFGLLVLMPGPPGRGRRFAAITAGIGTAAALGTGLMWHEGNGPVVAGAGLVGAGLLLLLALKGRDDSRLQTWLACLGLVVAVGPIALVGHVAAQGELMTMVAVLHLVTTAAWTGSVVAAVVLTRGVAKADRASVLRRTSVVGTSTFLIALVSGLLMSQSVVPSVGGLTGSAYGLGLIVKIALVVPVLALALLTRERLRFGRTTSVRVEAGLLLTVALVGVFVATQPPPAAPRFQPTPTWAADTSVASVQSDDLLVSAQIVPNTPGNRFLVVRTDDTRRPAPGKVTAVSASVGDGDIASLAQGNDGQWTRSVLVATPGATTFQITVTRPGLPDTLATLSWTVAPVPGTQVGGSPLNRYVALAIAGLIVTWLLVLLLEGVVRPRRRSDELIVDLRDEDDAPGAGYDVAVDEDAALSV